jgi:Tfp pilus assembly protein PilF
LRVVVLFCALLAAGAVDQSRLGHAVTLTRAGQYAEARKMLDGVAEPSEIGQRIAFHRLKAAIASGLKEEAAAADEMRLALALKPGDPDLLGAAAMAELQAGKLDDAVQHATLAPQREEYQVAFSTELIQRQAFRPAIEMLQGAAPRFPKSAKIRTLLGIAQYAAGDNPEAITSLEDAISLDPGFEPSHRCLALIVLESSAAPPQRTVDSLCDWDEIVCAALKLRAARQTGNMLLVQEATAILARVPDGNVVAHCELARAYEWTYDFPGARIQMEACVRLDPSPQNHYRLALIYKKLGQAELAERELQLRAEILQKMSEQTALGLNALQSLK